MKPGKNVVAKKVHYPHFAHVENVKGKTIKKTPEGLWWLSTSNGAAWAYEYDLQEIKE